MTQYSNAPQVKVNPQDSHLNKPGASVEGDSHSLPLNHDKGGNVARNKTSVPQVGGGAGDSRNLLGGDFVNNRGIYSLVS